MASQSNGSSESFVKATEIKFTKLFINGDFVDSLPKGDKEDVDLAVKVARATFNHRPWPHLPGYVSFTGSTEVGRLVMQAPAMSNLKPVSLELGGKPLLAYGI
ncbi:hypothetical protein LguiA_019948 [Lonicera macranthoides]